MDICLTVVAKLCFFNVFQYVDQVNCKKEKQTLAQNLQQHDLIESSKNCA